MPEPTQPGITETGFVPGDGTETLVNPVSTDNPTALEMGRDFTNALLGRITTLDPSAEEESTDDGNTGGTESRDAAESASLNASAVKQARIETPEPQTTQVETQSEDKPITLTQQELDRLVQSETDRRETIRRQREERDAQRNQNKVKLDRLRKSGDLEGFAAEYEAQEVEEQNIESTAAQRANYLKEVAVHFDSGILDPIALRLPQDEVQQLASQLNPVGIEGRAKFLHAVVDRLVEKAKAEGAAAAEKSLRNNQAFRKQLLLEGRENEEEPELVPARGRANTPTDMNEWINNLLPGRRG